MNLDQGVQVIDLLGLARRRGKLIAMVAGSVILATFWISMALPNLYTSSAMILVEPQSVDENLVNSGVRQSDLNERLGIMTAEMLSRTRLSAIIEKFELYRDESGSMQRSEIIDLMRSYISVEPVLSELEDGTRKKDLVFSTFRITFRHENKYVAAQVAQEIANSFIDANIESRTEITSKSLSFMRDEIGSLSGSLAVVEKSISAIKAESAGSLPEEFAGNQRLLQFGMADLRDAQRILSGAESDASYWKAQALTASTMSGGGDQNSPSYRLQSLELQRGSLLAKGFTKKHPDVVQADAEIALLQSQLAGGAAGEGDEDVAPKSVGEQNARSEQGRAELRAKSAQEDIDRLRVSIAEVERRIGGTASVAEKLDALSRQYDHLSHSYQDFSNRLQQASVQADLERRQLGEKFRILETAEPAPQPSSPNRLLLLSLGTIMGLALGGGIGLISEVADSSVHTSNELQAALGIPVLISVPNIMLESDRAMRSRRILRESLAAAFVVAFVLVGGVTTYYVVNVMGGADSDATPAAEESESTSAMIDLTSRAARG
jgi:succinoglycan biosynthesis transport protein ExoP